MHLQIILREHGLGLVVETLWVVGFGGSCSGGFWSMVWWIVVVSWFCVVVSCDSGVKLGSISFIFLIELRYGYVMMMVVVMVVVIDSWWVWWLLCFFFYYGV